MKIIISHIFRGLCILSFIVFSGCQTVSYDPVVVDFWISSQLFIDKDNADWGQKEGRKLSYSDAYKYWYSNDNPFTKDDVKNHLESHKEGDNYRKIQRMRNEIKKIYQ